MADDAASENIENENAKSNDDYANDIHALNDAAATSATAAPAISKDDARQHAIDQVFAHFIEGGTAYTRNGIPTPRMYCKGCLDNEIQSVRRAREEFGQGMNASVDVLRSIGG